MTRPLLALAAVALGTLGVAGCGDGPTVSERRDVPAFERIQVKGSADVTVRVGQPAGLVVRTQERRMKLIETEVRDGTLVIDEKERISFGSFGDGGDLDLTISAPRLSELDLSGSGNVTATGVTGRHFDADISGSGNIRAAGRVEAVSTSIAGSGNIRLFDLVARRGDARISGSGNISVNAADALDARISGSGNIRYRGRPRVDSKISGSGNVGSD